MSRAADFWMKINGVLMPTPVTCPITEYDMQSADSGRDEAALMHITQVRGNLLDCEPVWEGLTPAEAIKLRNAIAPLSFSVEVHFLKTTTRFQAYKGDRKWTPNFINNEIEKWDLSVKLIAL